MFSELPEAPVRSIVADEFFESQMDTSTERYIAYSFTQGLRKAMAHLNTDNIQEITATRSFNSSRDNLSAVSGSSVSSIMSGERIQRKQFELDFDRGESGEFPWPELRSVLAQPSTIYDLPIRRIVVRFNNEEFLDEWKSRLRSAIEIEGFPTNWIEPPFFAVLESKEPGNSDARDRLRDLHEDFYYKPKFQVDEDYEGMDWPLRTLDLISLWSYQAFVNRPEPIFTYRETDRDFDFTPRRIERYIMNYFHPEENYTGMIRNSDFAGLWRRVYSRDLTSTKRFAWEQEQEWVQIEES